MYEWQLKNVEKRYPNILSRFDECRDTSDFAIISLDSADFALFDSLHTSSTELSVTE